MDQPPAHASTSDLQDCLAARVKARIRKPRSLSLSEASKPRIFRARKGRKITRATKSTKAKKKPPAPTETADPATTVSFQSPTQTDGLECSIYNGTTFTNSIIPSPSQRTSFLDELDPVDSWLNLSDGSPPQETPPPPNRPGLFGISYEDLPLGSSNQFNTTSTTTTRSESSANIGIRSLTSSPGSDAVPLKSTNDINDLSIVFLNDPSRSPMARNPLNWGIHIKAISSLLSNTSLSPTDKTKHLNSEVSSSINSLLVAQKKMATGGFRPFFTAWRPASLLCKKNEEPENQYALLILNQPIENLDMLKLVWEKAFFRIAADGGANRLADAFRDPCLSAASEWTNLEVICGDLDSLKTSVKEDAKRRGTQIVEDQDQESTDFAKCVNYLRNTVFPNHSSASNIVCLGGLGGRVDQGLSQLHHLYMEQKDPNYKDGRVYLLSTESITFVLKRGNHRILVRDPQAPSLLGKHIGIIPLKGPSVITTRGLKWDVTNWLTEFGGQISTSNHVREDMVDIVTTADVLFTIELNFPSGCHDHPEIQRPGSPKFSIDDDMFFGTEPKPLYH